VVKIFGAMPSLVGRDKQIQIRSQQKETMLVKRLKYTSIR